MDINRAILNIDTVAPDIVQQLNPAENLARAFQEKGENPEFLGAEIDPLTAAFDNLAGRKQLEVFKFEHLIKQRRTGPPQNSPHP